MENLERRLRRINGRGYPAYKDLKGSYHFDLFDLDILHVQGDPFAAPSRIAIRVPVADLNLDSTDIAHPSRRVGLEDALLRSFRAALRNFGQQRGSGKSGEWGVVRLGQEIFARTACEIDPNIALIRFTVGLPAAGRRILGHEAEEMFCHELPQMVDRGIFQSNRDIWKAHANAAEDQDTLRALLQTRNWTGFIANGSILPRASGIRDTPLSTGAMPWKSPSELETEVTLPNAGKIKGSALPPGVTLICGGGYHGKSTVLNALARGVYNHVPGDGREYCVSRYETVAVRAEDGRSITNVNISGFISNLPNKKDTSAFSTENASGSTSQAANIIEMLELGCTSLLIDEDTSATNFMVRDRRMQELIATDKEPITPFIDRIQELYQQFGVSTILVIGGSGDYFDVADTVLVMEAYEPRIETDQAKRIAQKRPSQRQAEERIPFQLPSPRIPLQNSFDARRGRRPEKVRTSGTRGITFGSQEIDVSPVSQLVDNGQTRTVGDWLVRCGRGEANDRRSLQEICEHFEREAQAERLSITTDATFGDRVFARRFELAAAINRLRTLRIDTM